MNESEPKTRPLSAAELEALQEHLRGIERDRTAELWAEIAVGLARKQHNSEGGDDVPTDRS